MCDQWMTTIELPISYEQWQRLPRNPAFKYEYIRGQAYLSPRPRHYHAMLDLQPVPVEDPVDVRPMRSEDFAELVPLFAGSFRFVQPYGSLDDATCEVAARQALERTRSGGDGPWIEQASFVAYEEDRRLGAICITLLPGGDPSDWDSYYWKEPPPPDCIVRRLGRPHLTWIFVSPLSQGRGIGTALLAAAVRALQDAGFTELLSTFLLGNESSMLWHWRNGFRLLPYPGSLRRMQQRWRQY